LRAVCPGSRLPPVSNLTFGVIRQRLAAQSPRRVVDPAAREAAVAIVLLGVGEGVETLLIRRATRQGDPWSGQVAFPGGRRDPSDPALLATAIRETMEEVGVMLGEAQLLGELDDVHPRSHNLPVLVVRPFVFGVPDRPEVRESDEVAAHRWVGLNEFLLPGAYRETEIMLAGKPFPAYHVGGLVVWGMTERIVTPLLQLALG